MVEAGAFELTGITQYDCSNGGLPVWLRGVRRWVAL